jgi:hypothetical protein
MRLVKEDIWNFKDGAIGIPTNGYLTSKGKAVMGKGLALQAKQKYPDSELGLANLIKTHGHHVGFILMNPVKLLSIPVKPVSKVLASEKDKDCILPHVRHLYPVGVTAPGFHCKAELNIIENSLLELLEFMPENDLETVYLPLLGCGNGGLDVRDDLYPLLLKMKLPDSIVIVFPKDVSRA